MINNSINSTIDISLIDTPSLTCVKFQPNVLTINSPNNEKLLEITNDGTVYFRLNGDWKKIECENDISLMFVAVISGLTGFTYNDKNELISRIIKNYRENKIDNILK